MIGRAKTMIKGAPVRLAHTGSFMCAETPVSCLKPGIVPIALGESLNGGGYYLALTLSNEIHQRKKGRNYRRENENIFKTLFAISQAVAVKFQITNPNQA